MVKSLKYASEKRGFGPGALVHVGDVHEAVTRITLVDYSPQHFEQRALSSLGEAIDYRDKASVTWVIIEGLADATVVESIGQYFDIHPLVLEDILNTHQRTKLEEHDDYLYIVLKSLFPSDKVFSVSHEQVSLLVLEGFIFTFKEKADDLLEPVLKRLKNSRGRIRSAGADYLMYAVLDAIVDQNFDLIDQLEETMAVLEEEIFSNPTPQVLGKIQSIKREIINMRRYVAPIRDILNGLLRSESALVHKNTSIYLRDVHDHTLRIIESIEIHRDIISSLLEIYLSSISTRMNEVMKLLTVFASIFIPLTFLTGVYGMNFDAMPELSWPWGYPAIWLVFITITIALLVYFWRKDWL